jgi:hypothetical protein
MILIHCRACSGNANELCGRPNRLSLFWSGQTVAAPANKLTIGTYDYYGCMTEATNGRALASTGGSIQFKANLNYQVIVGTASLLDLFLLSPVTAVW